MTWIPAFAGMTAGWEVRIAPTPNTGHPGDGLGHGFDMALGGVIEPETLGHEDLLSFGMRAHAAVPSGTAVTEGLRGSL